MKRSNNFKLAIISDEISPNLPEAIAFLKQNHISYVELRSIGGKNIVNYSLKEIKEFAAILKTNKIEVSMIASPLFKWFTSDKSDKSYEHYFFSASLSYEDKKEIILKTFEIAKILKTKYVRIFSYLKEDYQNFILNKDPLFLFAIEEAEKNNMTLLMENEFSCTIDTMDKLISFLLNFKHPHLQALIDPSNLYKIHQKLSYSDMEKIKTRIKYFQLKDFVRFNDDIHFVPLGEGIINYKRIISDIISVLNNKDIFLSIETHVKENKVEITQKSLNNLRNFLSAKRVGYAIIGAGNISRNHALAIKSNTNSELRGVFDTNPEKSKLFGEVNDCTIFNSLDTLLSDSSIDVVSICTPHNTHFNLVKKVALKEKFVLCEKPFVLNSQQLKDFISNKKLSKKIFIVLQNNFNDAVRYLYTAIKENRLGKINSFSLNLRWWRNDNYFNSWHGIKAQAGGTLYNQAIHSLSVLRRIIKLHVDKIYTLTKIVRKNSEIEDVLYSIVRMKNGILGNIEVNVYTVNRNTESSLFIVGSKGSIKIGGLALSNIEYDSTASNLPSFSNSGTNEYGSGHIKLVKTLSNYILNGSKEKDYYLLTKPKELLETIKFIEKIYNAAKK